MVLHGEAQYTMIKEIQYRLRAAQLLTSYSRPGEKGEQSFLDKLLAGMPRRLEQCKAKRYGRCGK